VYPVKSEELHKCQFFWSRQLPVKILMTYIALQKKHIIQRSMSTPPAEVIKQGFLFGAITIQYSEMHPPVTIHDISFVKEQWQGNLYIYNFNIIPEACKAVESLKILVNEAVGSYVCLVGALSPVADYRGREFYDWLNRESFQFRLRQGRKYSSAQ